MHRRYDLYRMGSIWDSVWDFNRPSWLKLNPNIGGTGPARLQKYVHACGAPGFFVRIGVSWFGMQEVLCGIQSAEALLLF